MKYGDILEYIDCTYDIKINQAREWCKNNRATLEELIDKRVQKDDGLHRFFQINKIINTIPIKKSIEERNSIIRRKREKAYKDNTDSLYMDYQESLARGEETAEEKKQLWLSAKDKIREDNPYIGETK